MDDLQTLIERIKNPRQIAIFILIFLVCMIFGYARGSIGGLIMGLVIGIFLSLSGMILILKHEEKQEEMEKSLIIPKIGMTDKKEQWLRKKKLRELKAENRIDLMIKMFWWIVIVMIGLSILYWISPIIYYSIQAAAR
jgi:hypothetical protein